MDKDEVKKDVSWLGARLRETSTYAGLGVLLGGLFHLSNANDWVTALTSIGIGLGGVIGILTREKK